MADDARRRTDVTALLRQWRRGERDALEELLRVVYDELRRMARGQLARRDRRNTLQSTELVHEAFLRLVDQKADWQNRVHFYGIAATCMRRILVDHARRKRAAKRPPAAAAVDLDTSIVSASRPIETILAVDEALTRLAEEDPRQAAIAELKFFGNLEVPEIAEVVGVSAATVKRDWSAASKTLQTMLGAKK